VMSFTFFWKQLALALSATAVGAYLWVSVWWTTAAATFGLLTRLRLYAGSILLLLAFLRTLTWLNSITSEGVLACLVVFLWVTQEEALQHRRTMRVQ